MSSSKSPNHKRRRAEAGGAGGGDDVDALRQRRDAARAAKDYALADKLREQLLVMGVKLQDHSGGSEVVKDQKAEQEAKRAKKKAKKIRKQKEVFFEREEQRRVAKDEGGEESATAPIEQVLEKGVRIVDLKLGRGPELEDRKKCFMRYEGRLTDNRGKVFDRCNNFSFRLGRGEVIAGWDLGVAGMRRGGQRRIIVPPGAGYGSKAMAGIPRDSTLCFTVTAL